ncbi:dynamin family protein [Niallia sp. 03133]|uniref:dynamin family protein n=1 Tax=Niallia sp. 03133 TaxID=3458060 RepID=UPI0040445895
MKALLKKTYYEEFTLTFCGHYSAGKSSLINHLLKTDTLPSSPIPTTANIIRLRKGEKLARIHTPFGNTILYENVDNIKELQNLCKNNKDVKEMEISLPTIKLPYSVIVIDTPGIDSTDQAHFLSADSSIHLSDIIFYVVDYNHVQSEVNVAFLKKLKENGKDFILIINQMDKHKEEELSLLAFKQSVKASFSSFGIKPAHLFFISVKEKDLPFNELQELQTYIEATIKKKDHLLPVTTEQSFSKIQKDHLQFMNEKRKEQLAKVNEILKNGGNKEWKVLEQEKQIFQSEVDSIWNVFFQQTDSWENSIASLIKNAYLMPYQNRELAKDYVASEQKDFKIGFFSTKQKVEKEKEKRLDDFSKQLMKYTQLQIISPLIQFFEKNKAKNEGVNMMVMEKIENYPMPINRNNLHQFVNKHAILSENYVLHFCGEVENYIKSKVKIEAFRWMEIMKQEHQHQTEQKLSETKKALRKSTLLVEAKQKQQQIMSDWQEWKKQLADISIDKDDHSIDFLSLIEEKAAQERVIPPLCIDKTMETDQVEIVGISADEKHFISENDIEKILVDLNNLSDLIKELSGFKQIASKMLKKINSIRTKEYKICLFGAFSAGKSSFANALINYPLLPVSPNPTTSTVNRIVPIDINNPHGTVKVYWKTEEEIRMELKEHLQLYQAEADSLSSSISIIQNIIQMQKEDFSSNHHYLQAFLSGYEENASFLGTTTVSNTRMLANYVAAEKNACFIKSIDVFFDCDLTRKGITLIDTPGGDSINSRHTAVSFDYIKEADCILYLSYYHHSFSKADEEFLSQLGRLKEAMETDKMFFIVNAMDLAESDAELIEVMQYLEQQLQKYGIRYPRISPVSSLYYKNNDYRTYLDQLKGKLAAFIQKEWMNITLVSLQNDGIEAISLLKKWLHASKNNKQEKEKEMKRLLAEKQVVLSNFQKEESVYLQKKMNKEIEEQLFYLQQRVFFRINDLVKEAFHPSILAGKNIKKERFIALQVFLQQISFEFEQELRAASLRLEIFYNKFRHTVYTEIKQKIASDNGDIILSWDEGRRIKVSFHAPFRTLDQTVFKSALHFYKNPRSFFEQNDRKFLTEELIKTLKHYSKEFIQKETTRLQSYFIENWKMHYKEDNDQFILQAEEYYEGKQALLVDSENIHLIETILAKVDQAGFLQGNG